MSEPDGPTPGKGRIDRASLHLPTVAAVGVLVFAVALITHELAHAIVAYALGGGPALISSTDTRGDWSGLSANDILLVGVSGSAVNAVLAGVGWLVFRRGVGKPTTGTALAWLTFAVNAWIPTTYLVVSPAFGFGDWATIIAEFPNRGPLRASLAVTGLFVAGLLWKGTVATLARLVGNGPKESRRLQASRLVRTAWLAGGAVAVAASLLSPLDLTWAVPIAAGSTLGTTWPILAAADRVAEHPVPGSPLDLRRSISVLLGGALAGLVLVLVFGPGIRLSP